MMQLLGGKKDEPEIKILAREKTRFNDIYVIKNGAHRELWFKGDGVYYLQSRMDTQQENPLALVYSRMVMASLLFCPAPKRMLMIGLGGAAVTNCLGKWFPKLKIDIVEVDGKVIEVSKKYFSLRESSHCRVFEEDGRVFIQKRKNQEPYDWIILDAFKSGSIPYHLKTQEFYQEIKAVLSPGGVVNSNLYGKGNTLKPRDTKTFLSVFPSIYCFEDDDEVATVLIATDGKRWSEEKIRERALTSQELPGSFSMSEVAKAYRPGKFQEDSASMFKDTISEEGFLHDVERENLQSSQGRRYPIINAY
ncbi:MAG: fused MFS/spermidine synthase [Nitrospinaceae bacterium]|nr:fused MFS/spermidine synthase [Nitrospina sp.]MBT5377268.1 fused MFS/spermidine synthase [Nitrospinaceae bacterium]MBT6345355.1 fused MFS/spermidine synthase [Nitrospina sp.]